MVMKPRRAGPGGSERPPRVLYLSFYFPPSRASGVFRARATANHLAEAGWDVTVLTAPREFFEHHLDGAADPSLEATVDPRVKVERPAMNTYAFEHDVRRFGCVPPHVPERRPEGVSGRAAAHLRRALPRLDAGRRCVPPWPGICAGPSTWCWRPATRSSRSSPPGSSAKLLRIPYVVDFRDAWTFNQFTEEIRFPEGGQMMRWEEKVLRDAPRSSSSTTACGGGTPTGTRSPRSG